MPQFLHKIWITIATKFCISYVFRNKINISKEVVLQLCLFLYKLIPLVSLLRYVSTNMAQPEMGLIRSEEDKTFFNRNLTAIWHLNVTKLQRYIRQKICWGDAVICSYSGRPAGLNFFFSCHPAGVWSSSLWTSPPRGGLWWWSTSLCRGDPL